MATCPRAWTSANALSDDATLLGSLPQAPENGFEQLDAKEQGDSYQRQDDRGGEVA
jgi:hypothetical protein